MHLSVSLVAGMGTFANMIFDMFFSYNTSLGDCRVPFQVKKRADADGEDFVIAGMLLPREGEVHLPMFMDDLKQPLLSSDLPIRGYWTDGVRRMVPSIENNGTRNRHGTRQLPVVSSKSPR